MLTDTKLRTLKPEQKAYKLTDRDGLYAMVLVSGAISFRYNYRINGRQETLMLGRYGPTGISLAEARQRLADAKQAISDGRSPGRQKQREIQKTKAANSFGEWTEIWLKRHQMAESTRDMRRSVYEREMKGIFGRQKVSEISQEYLRCVCEKIVARGAPATAIHVRDIVQWVYRYAMEKGHRFVNPAELVLPKSIATFKPKNRSLAPQEIGWMYAYLEQVATAPTNRLAVKLLLITMLRKKVVRPSRRREMAQRAVQERSISVRLACSAFQVSQTCYRYVAKTDAENEEIANWLLRLTDKHRNWGFGLCFLYLRNVRGFGWNHKRVYRIYRELELNLRIRPRKRLVSQYRWDDIDHVQRVATEWVWFYNHERPNMALGGITPKQRLAMAA